jgi:catechol 2,3-dioxygenase-like lactoylglutathione lyase family enzyme
MSKPTIRRAIPTLRVASIDRALPLYEGLGFSVSWQHQISVGAPRLTSVTQGTSELFLTEHPIARYGAVVHFVVDGLQALVDRAGAQGFEPTFGPEDRPWGDREAYFTDVDGNVLRFGEPISID